MSDEVLKKLLDSLSQEQKEELIQQVLNSNVKSDPVSPEKKPAARASGLPEGSMTEIKKSKTQGQITGVPITDMPRFNKFTDDGSEHAEDVTPHIDLTERKRRPFKKIEQICTKCNKAFQTHPQHRREFYVCDKCLRR